TGPSRRTKAPPSPPWPGRFPAASPSKQAPLRSGRRRVESSSSFPDLDGALERVLHRGFDRLLGDFVPGRLARLLLIARMDAAHLCDGPCSRSPARAGLRQQMHGDLALLPQAALRAVLLGVHLQLGGVGHLLLLAIGAGGAVGAHPEALDGV